MLIARKEKGWKLVSVYPAEKLTYVPAGWHKGYNYTSFPSMKAGYKPAHKRGALVMGDGFVMPANDFRTVDTNTEQELKDIDRQMKELRRKYHQILIDRFMTFDLVKEGDVETEKYRRSYPTKAEAEKAGE